MKQIINYRNWMALLALVFLIASCSKQKVGEAAFPDQKIYMTTADLAVKGPGANGIYNINSVAVPGQVYRYVVDAAGGKFNVGLGIYRSGTTLTGAVNASVTPVTDTISKLILSTLLPSDTQVLPADKMSFPSSVSIADGSNIVTFNLAVDLNFLIANLGKKFAVGIKIASTDRQVVSSLSTTIVYIDTQFLIPVPAFTSLPDAVTAKKINFTNTSVNALTYSWDFGDGSPAVTTASPSYTYAASGSYVVKLTTSGALGDANKKTQMVTVVVP